MLEYCLQGSSRLNGISNFGCAELSGNLMLMQGQDESDETKRTLESCNAIAGAIEVGSVSIDPIKVLIMRLRLLLQIHHGSHSKPGILEKICASLHLYKHLYCHDGVPCGSLFLTDLVFISGGKACSKTTFREQTISSMQDPADEEEQAKVMSQAQTLLDCVADLIVHCGVLSTVDILQEGVQLSRRTSLDCPADSWRISGNAPSPDGKGESYVCGGIAGNAR